MATHAVGAAALQDICDRYQAIANTPPESPAKHENYAGHHAIMARVMVGQPASNSVPGTVKVANARPMREAPHTHMDRRHPANQTENRSASRPSKTDFFRATHQQAYQVPEWPTQAACNGGQLNLVYSARSRIIRLQAQVLQ